MPADVNGDPALLQRLFFILTEYAAIARNGKMGNLGGSFENTCTLAGTNFRVLSALNWPIH